MRTVKFPPLIALLAICASTSLAQSPARRPWTLKVDLAGYASQTLAIEGEFMLTRRLSVLGQLGHVSGGFLRGFLDSFGLQSRIGAKCYLGLGQSTRMAGFAIRCEVAGRFWHSQGYHLNFTRWELVGIAALSHAWQPHDRILVEPYLGIGRSRSRVDLGGGTTVYQYLEAPNSPWAPLGIIHYDFDRDLRGYRWGAWQLAFGLMLGFRI